MSDADKLQGHTLPGVAEALRRAALRARKLACQIPDDTAPAEGAERREE